MQIQVKDITKEKKKLDNWKEQIGEYRYIEGILQDNSDVVLKFLHDMEEGRNIGKGTKKGGRSPLRLNTLRHRLVFLIKLLEKRGSKNIFDLDEDIITKLFHDMRTGKLKKKDGTQYKSVADYVKDFKCFWHWFMKINKKQGIAVQDITEDLDTSKEENTFVYFTKEELEGILPYFTEDEQVRMLFMFDTIVRSPKELMNIRVFDINPDFSEVTIRVSKTYPRTIKLLVCSEGLKEYVKRKKLKDNDFVFDFSPFYFNRKLQKVATQVFGDRMTKGGKRYGEITAYDFRHSGACHWRKGAYKSKIDALMYRGGWSNLTILNYYTKKLGMKDSIEKSDLLIEADLNELQKQKDKTKQLEKELKQLQNQMKNVYVHFAKQIKTKKS